jgi:glycosyltransferase involved in cell wall biosynthesis
VIGLSSSSVSRRAPGWSVVLCTFNRARLVGRAIASVVAQSFGDWELVVIDDGSTDDTAAIVGAWAERDARIRYHRQRNHGLAGARNRGLELARGAIVTFLDSDDAYAPDHLATRVAYLRAHPGLDIVHGGVRLVGPRERQYVPDMARPGARIHLTQCHIGGTLVAPRGVLIDAGGFARVLFAEDSELFRRLRARHAVGEVAAPTYIYDLGGDDRMAEIAKGGEEEIAKYRRRHGGRDIVTETLRPVTDSAWSAAS